MMTTADIETSTITKGCNNNNSCCKIDIVQFPCLDDNYGFLLHDPTTGETAAMDTPCATNYQTELTKRGWTLTHIFNTHYHWDHAGGNWDLKQKYPNVKIISPKKEKMKIPGVDVAANPGDLFPFGTDAEILVMGSGGHTKGHLSFYIASLSTIFVGDSLFSLGCGAMFEGTPEQYWESMERLLALPEDTLIYCAHEYTHYNLKFALHVEPNNPDLLEYAKLIEEKRKKKEPTVPTVLILEKKTNPFLRVNTSTELRANMKIPHDCFGAQAFGIVRKAKDQFK